MQRFVFLYLIPLGITVFTPFKPLKCFISLEKKHYLFVSLLFNRSRCSFHLKQVQVSVRVGVTTRLGLGFGLGLGLGLGLALALKQIVDFTVFKLLKLFILLRQSCWFHCG